LPGPITTQSILRSPPRKTDLHPYPPEVSYGWCQTPSPPQTIRRNWVPTTGRPFRDHRQAGLAGPINWTSPLSMPPSHNTFHISLLEHYGPTKQVRFSAPLPPRCRAKTAAPPNNELAELVPLRLLQPHCRSPEGSGQPPSPRAPGGQAWFAAENFATGPLNSKLFHPPAPQQNQGLAANSKNPPEAPPSGTPPRRPQGWARKGLGFGHCAHYAQLSGPRESEMGRPCPPTRPVRNTHGSTARRRSGPRYDDGCPSLARKERPGSTPAPGPYPPAPPSEPRTHPPLGHSPHATTAPPPRLWHTLEDPSTPAPAGNRWFRPHGCKDPSTAPRWRRRYPPCQGWGPGIPSRCPKRIPAFGPARIAVGSRGGAPHPLWTRPVLEARSRALCTERDVLHGACFAYKATALGPPTTPPSAPPLPFAEAGGPPPPPLPWSQKALAGARCFLPPPPHPNPRRPSRPGLGDRLLGPGPSHPLGDRCSGRGARVHVPKRVPWPRLGFR